MKVMVPILFETYALEQNKQKPIKTLGDIIQHMGPIFMTQFRFNLAEAGLVADLQKYGNLFMPSLVYSQ